MARAIRIRDDVRAARGSARPAVQTGCSRTLSGSDHLISIETRQVSAEERQLVLPRVLKRTRRALLRTQPAVAALRQVEVVAGNAARAGVVDAIDQDGVVRTRPSAELAADADSGLAAQTARGLAERLNARESELDLAEVSAAFFARRHRHRDTSARRLDALQVGLVRIADRSAPVGRLGPHRGRDR